jgi:hypothetical protein
MVKDCVVRGCETFASYVLQHRTIIPQWTIAAFWWESMAAQGGISAGDLALFIEGWKDRFQRAVSWWREGGANPPNVLPHKRDDTLVWWRFYRDLWHSGVLDERTNQISPYAQAVVSTLVPGGGRYVPCERSCGRQEPGKTHLQIRWKTL